MPSARKNGWLESVDFSTMYHQIVSLCPELLQLLENIEESTVFNSSKIYYRPQEDSSKRRLQGGVSNFNRIEEHGAG